MTRAQAVAEFRLLVRLYGLQWTASVPASAWRSLAEVNKVLTEADRRAALGLPAIDRAELQAAVADLFK